MTKKIALFALVAILTTASLKAQLFLEFGMGPQSNHQNLSLFDNGHITTHSLNAELVLDYQLHEKFAFGLEMLASTYLVPATAESLGTAFVGINTRWIRPLRFTDDIIINLYSELSPGCLFLTDKFDFEGQSYKSERWGIGIDYGLGLSIPFYNDWELGVRCGLLVSYLSKPKIDLNVPAKDYKAGEQMLAATRFVVTISRKLF